MHPSSDLSKSQVDRLGDRLREDKVSENDLRLLDSYRRSFTDAYDDVVWQITHELKLEPTGRKAKTNASIIDKLQRESIRLSQMQDIAGCRIVVNDIAAQDNVTARLIELFEQTTVVDRRQNPSHGYRAVHVIVKNQGKLVEVQVRTALQDRWASFTEKLSDVLDDTSIKYGGGDEQMMSYLYKMSDVSLNIEMALNRKDIAAMVVEWQEWPELSRKLGDAIRRVRSRDDFSN